MKELYELKEKLCNELKGYSKKDMTAGALDVVDKLAHAAKNIDKLIDSYEHGYSNAYDNRYDDRGRYSRKDPMMHRDGYSYHGEMMDELRGLMNSAPDDRTKQEFKRFIQRMEEI